MIDTSAKTKEVNNKSKKKQSATQHPPADAVMVDVQGRTPVTSKSKKLQGTMNVNSPPYQRRGN
jgi:hypothetical protein